MAKDGQDQCAKLELFVPGTGKIERFEWKQEPFVHKMHGEIPKEGKAFSFEGQSYYPYKRLLRVGTGGKVVDVFTTKRYDSSALLRVRFVAHDRAALGNEFETMVVTSLLAVENKIKAETLSNWSHEEWQLWHSRREELVLVGSPKPHISPFRS